MNSKSGFTLIECMVASAISLIVMSLLSAVFYHVEKNVSQQAALSQIQEKSFSGIEMLHHEIEMAGYIGCPKLTDDFPLFNSTQYKFHAQNKIIVTDQFIQIRKASDFHEVLVENMNNNTELWVSAGKNFNAKDILIISDCKSADIFFAQNISHSGNLQKITAQQPLSMRYGKNAEVSLLEADTYYVDSTGKRDEHGKLIYGLYRTNIRNHKLCLIDGVISLHGALASDSAGVTLDWIFASGALQKKWQSFVRLEN